MIKTKIVMDSGKEYIYDGGISDVKRLCVNKLPMGAEVLINGFVYIANIYINPSHISSLEEFNA